MRSSIYFLGQCRKLEKAGGRRGKLAGRCLDLGLIGKDKTRGHVNQAWGVAQRYLKRFPDERSRIRKKSFKPYEPKGKSLARLIDLVQSGHGKFGRKGEYNWRTIRGYLRPKYGGVRRGGGGGDNELKIVLRLAAEI